MKFLKIIICGIIIFKSWKGLGQSYDGDAQKFFTATAITNDTIKNAVNCLVINLKDSSLWSKMKAIYPMVGGDATKHSYNLKDTGAFKITWYGSWIHSSTGADPDGSTAYGNTHIIPSSDLTANSTHLAYYSRESTDLWQIQIGTDDGTNRMSLDIRYAGLYTISDQYNCDANQGRLLLDNSSLSGIGFFIADRASSSSNVIYKNGSSIASNSTTGGSLPPYAIYIGAMNSSGTAVTFSDNKCAFSSIGSGLSFSEALTYNRIVDSFFYHLEHGGYSCGGSSGGGSSGSDSNWVRSGNNIYFNNGNVGIGTDSDHIHDTNYKLFVETGIRTRKLKVDAPSVEWPDYVFDKNFKLPTLVEIENFIKRNQHLPGIPSAKEVEKNGVDVGINQAMLLKKIEELTLIIIQQNKAQNNLKRVIEEQNKRIEEQNKRIKTIERKQARTTK